MNWHCFHCSADLIGFYFLNSVKTFIWFKSGFLAAQRADFNYCVSGKTNQNKPKQIPHRLVNWLNLNENFICYQSKPVLFFSVNFCTSQTDIFAICKYHNTTFLVDLEESGLTVMKRMRPKVFINLIKVWCPGPIMATFLFPRKKKNAI